MFAAAAIGIALVVANLLSGQVASPMNGVGNVFAPLAPCRVSDSRLPALVAGLGGPSLGAASTRTIPVRQSACQVPAEAAAYSLNITVVPHGPLPFLSVWPSGQPQPLVSTLNSFDGHVVANAAITPAGANGSIDVFASNATDLIIDINGVFLPEVAALSPPRLSMTCSGPGRPQISIRPPIGPPAVINPCVMILEPRFKYAGFVPLQPCRIMDTRPAYPGPFVDSAGVSSWFQGVVVPQFFGASRRTLAVPLSGCRLPSNALAYSLNATVVPRVRLSYLTLFPTGQSQPLVSTLNSFDGRVIANSAITPAGDSGAIDAFVTDDADLILDTNGYFGNAPSVPSLLFYPVQPCRVLDTRSAAPPLGGNPLPGDSALEFSPSASLCGIPAAARAVSLNATVVPNGPLAYLTLFPSGQQRPLVSTLNAFQGQVAANAAIVPVGTNGKISVYATNQTHVIVDLNGYFQ